MKKKKTAIKEHLAHFNIAGFTYYDGPEAFKELRIGTLLTLQLAPENDYDPRAVKILYKDYHLGFIPREENRIFYKLLKIGFDHFEVRIQRIDDKMHPEEQIWVVVKLVGKG